MRRFPVTVWLLAALPLALHLATAGRYGVFRDELYYLACADHLAWGYVDHPPLSIALLAAWKALFGDSLLALRLPPALAGSGLVLLVAALARRLGGGSRAQVLAAATTVAAPVALALTGFYSMNALDLLFWAGGALVLARLAGGGDPRWWLAFGAVAGLGLMNKLSVGFLGLGVAVALPLTPLRPHLATRWPWLGAALSLAILAPHIVWQALHDWPTAEFMANARAYKIAAVSPPQFLAQVALDAGPVNLPVWLAGLAWLLAAPRRREHRLLALVFLAVLALLLTGRSKPYYLAAAMPILFAAGGVALAAALDRLRPALARPLTAVVALLLLAGGAVAAPLAIPVLAPEDLVRYQRTLGIAPSSGERQALGALPQHFADRFGWREMAETVAGVWRDLPPAERERTLVVTANYGEAGALLYYGEELGIPAARVASQHNSFFLWGPGDLSGIDTVLGVGIPPEALAESFAEVELAATVESTWAMPYETGELVWMARRPTRPIEEAWREGKHYI